MAEQQGFPLPGSSYKELIKIIQGYAQVSGEAVPIDVASVIAVHETIVSSNNKFLVAIGIVQGGRKKTMTATGRSLAHALEHNVQEEVSRLWRAIVDATEFLQKIIAAVRIRKGMDEASLEAHVAYSAGQPKTPRILTGAATVVEILKIAGLLKEDSGNLVAASIELDSLPDLESIGSPFTRETIASWANKPTLARATGDLKLSIAVSIQCTPEDLEGLGQKLRRIVDDFNEYKGRDSSNDRSQD